MTGTLTISALEPVPSLDPGYIEIEQPPAPILAACEIQAEAEARASARFSAVRREASPSLAGLTFGALARMHLQQQRMATRTALLATEKCAKGDAIAAVDLVAELNGDGELTDHLLPILRSYLSVD